MADVAAVDITVFTVAMTGGHPADPDEVATALHDCRVVINGVEIPAIVRVEVVAAADEFIAAKLFLTPSSIQFVRLPSDQFHAQELPVVP